MRHDPLTNFSRPLAPGGIPWQTIDAYRHDLATWQPLIDATGWQDIGGYDGETLALARDETRWLFGRQVDGIWHDMRGGGLEPVPDFRPGAFVPVSYEDGEAVFLHSPEPTNALSARSDIPRGEATSLFEIMMGMTPEAWDAAALFERDMPDG